MYALCPIREEVGEGVSWRPPPWVFFTIWPVLYILLGYAWASTEDPTSTVMLGSLVALLCLWQLIYGCLGRRWVASAVVAASAVVSWAAVGILDRQQRLCLLPVALWLTFAFAISVREL